MIKRKTRLALGLGVNSALVVMESVACLMLMFNYGNGFNFSYFIHFTHYSNLFLLISSLMKTVGIIRCLLGIEDKVSHPVRVFRLMSVSSAVLVPLVVIFIFIPMNNFEGIGETLLSKTNLLEYVICPLLAAVSFVVLGNYKDFGFTETFIATLPTILYAIVMTILNALGVVRGPYVFFLVHEQPLWLSAAWFVIIVGISYVVSYILVVLAHKDNQVPDPGKKEEIL